MNICVLVQDYLPETGAGPARISELAALWRARGHSVSVLTGFPSRRLPGQADGVVPPQYRGRLAMSEEIDGVRVHRSWLFTTPSRGFYPTLLNNVSFAASSFFRGLHVPDSLDVLIASGPPFFALFAGAAIAGIRGVPLILDVRDLWPDYVADIGLVRNRLAIRAMFASERWLLRQACAISVVTESFKRRIAEKGIAPEVVFVAPNGVDVERYYASNESYLPQGLEIRDGVQLVTYLGTMGVGQGLGAVIDAFRILREQGCSAHLALVGDGPERRILEAKLASQPLAGVSIHQPIPRNRTRALYNRSDAVVVPHAALPVLGDTVPSKIFEVMACERPLVAALNGEGARIVRRSQGGVLAKPEDPASIAHAIASVLALSKEDREAMGRRGRAFAAAEYGRSAVADRYLQVLTHLATNRQF